MIRIDDYDIQKVDLDSLRQQIGIVPQDSMLFDGSIRDNIAMNAPDATDEEVIHASRVACAHSLRHGSCLRVMVPVSVNVELRLVVVSVKESQSPVPSSVARVC